MLLVNIELLIKLTLSNCSLCYIFRTFNSTHVGMVTLIGWRNETAVAPDADDDEVLVSATSWISHVDKRGDARSFCRANFFSFMFFLVHRNWLIIA